MSQKLSELGYILDDGTAATTQESATASVYTADMRAQLNDPEEGTICFDPDTHGLLFWNGVSWTPVISSTSTTRTVVRVTADYSMTKEQDVIVADATSGPITVCLPKTADCVGREIAVVKSDSTTNTVTLQHSGTDVIGCCDDTTFTLNTPQSIVNLQAFGTGTWYCV